MSIRLLLASVLLTASLAATAAPPLRILTEDYPPFNMMGSGGRISGMSTDVLQEGFRRAGISYAIEMLPWIRALNLTILESNTCLYSTARTEAREHQFKWVGPLVDNPWVLYGRNDSRHAIKSLEEARRFKIGGYSGDATAQYLIDRGFDVDLASTDQLNIKKLLAGRIDFWATGKYPGAALLAREKVTQLHPILTFNTPMLYLACNPGMPDALIQQLNDQLRSMQRDGTLAHLYAKYINQKE